MPNLCLNTLLITGPEDQLRQFQQYAGEDGEALDINRFVPMPKEVLSSAAAPGQDPEDTRQRALLHVASNARRWALEHWGTTQSAFDVQREEIRDGVLKYHFCTAWEPFSAGVISAMSARFPELRIELHYEEPGNIFKGWYAAERGEILEDYCRQMTEDEIEEFFQD